MKLMYLEEFLALANAGNYSEAAENLYLSSSTLSRHILLLEEDLGGPLFIRESRKVVLTKLGELLLPYAKSVTEQMNEFYCRVNELKGEKQERLSVGFANSIFQYGLMKKMMRFRELNQNGIVTFSEGAPINLFQMLRDDKCDFVVGYEYHLYGEGYCVEKLIDDQFCIAVPSTHPFAGSKSVTLNELKDCQFILNTKTMPVYKMYEKLFANAGITPQVLMNVSSTNSIMKMVAGGLGISIVNRLRFQNEKSDDYRLVEIEPTIQNPVALIYKAGRNLTPLQSKFIDFMKDNKED